MVAKHEMIDWADDLQTARDLVVKVETGMLLAGWIKTGQQTQQRLDRAEQNLANVIWMCMNEVRQPKLFEKEPPDNTSDGSGGGVPW